MNIEKFPKVTVILRGYTYSQTRTVVKNLVGTCLGSVEITMNTPGALESIRKISQEFGAQIMVGAGTVLTLSLIHILLANILHAWVHHTPVTAHDEGYL